MHEAYHCTHADRSDPTSMPAANAALRRAAAHVHGHLQRSPRTLSEERYASPADHGNGVERSDRTKSVTESAVGLVGWRGALARTVVGHAAAVHTDEAD